MRRATSAPNGFNSPNVPTEYDFEAADSDSGSRSEASDMSSAHAGYHMAEDEDDDYDEQMSLTPSQQSSASILQ